MSRTMRYINIVYICDSNSAYKMTVYYRILCGSFNALFSFYDCKVTCCTSQWLCVVALYLLIVINVVPIPFKS